MGVDVSGKVEVNRKLFLDIAALSDAERELLFAASYLVILQGRTGLSKKQQDRALYQLLIQEQLLSSSVTS